MSIECNHLFSEGRNAERNIIRLKIIFQTALHTKRNLVLRDQFGCFK